MINHIILHYNRPCTKWCKIPECLNLETKLSSVIMHLYLIFVVVTPHDFPLMLHYDLVQSLCHCQAAWLQRLAVVVFSQFNPVTLPVGGKNNCHGHHRAEG